MKLALILFTALTAAAQSNATAQLQPREQRRPAPGFKLRNSGGKTIDLKKFRGKVVLLDFWATWCHGCKEEIPWFAEFDRKYGGKGLRVIGVSMDDGWNTLKPFLATAKIPYRIVLGDESTAKSYKIENMPDTFLIDRKGNIAASYTGIVDRANLEANIQQMLAQR